MTETKRTNQQNKAMWKYCELVADWLNDSGQDMRLVLKEEVPIEWTKESTKKYLWKSVQKAMYPESESSKELTTKQMSKVSDNVVRMLAERVGCEVGFPSIENIMILMDGQK